MFAQYLREPYFVIQGNPIPLRVYTFRGTLERMIYQGVVRWVVKGKQGKVTAVAFNIGPVANKLGISLWKKLGWTVVIGGVMMGHRPGQPSSVWVKTIRFIKAPTEA